MFEPGHLERHQCRPAWAAGELTRLVALLRVFEDHPVEAAALSTDVIWAAIGERGQRKLHGMV